MEQIVEILGNLDESTEASEALEIIRQLDSFLNSFFDASKVDQLIAAALPASDDRGILKYLLSHIAVNDKQKKEHEKPKLEALKVLQKLLDDPRLRICVAPACYRIYKTLSAFRRNKLESSNVQNESLQGLILLLQNFEDRVREAETEDLEGEAEGEDRPMKEENFDLPKLYTSLLVDQEKSSYTPTVRGRILQCLGVLSGFGKDTFLKTESQYQQLLAVFVSAVKDQVESRTHHLEANILLGCMKGLDKFLTAFKDKVSADQEAIQVFYNNLEKIINPELSIAHDSQSPKLKRREFQRAALELVANHAEFFKDNLFEKHELWLNDLLIWSKSSNADDSKSGIKAIMSFLEATSAHAEVLLGTKQKTDRVNLYVQHLANKFKEILDNKDSIKVELRVAVKGAGLLAAVCEDGILLDSLITKVMQYAEAIIIQLNMEVTDKYSGSTALVPTCLEAAGKMVLAMKVYDADSQGVFQNRLHVVENLSILLITSYPELKENYRYFASDSLLNVVKGLYSTYFRQCEPFLDSVIHEGLTHIIASPTQAEADILVESYNQMNEAKKKDAPRSTESIYNRLGIRTVKFYTRFWTGLMKHAEDPEWQAITCLIYNKIMDWVLKTIAKLDLSIQYVETEDTDEINLADPAYDTKASKVKDFQLFINIVDFLTPFVRYSDPKLFSGWIDIFIEKSYECIEKHPLVSGFYRIMALTFEVSRNLKYFQENDGKIFMLSCSFLQSLARRIQEFRDDLLLAVLEVWLAAPDEMIIRNGHFLLRTLEAVFSAGKNSLTMARRGFYAMQRWFQIPEFPEAEMEKLTNKLLPVWLSYFSDSGFVEEEERLEIKESRRSSKKGSRYRRLQFVLGQELKETSLKELQLEILKFIGSYGHFIEAAMDDEHLGFSVERKILKYDVPFQDIKPTVFIDNFLPRLMELCHQSSDRQLRSSACEVFHTYILYFLGSHTRAPEEAQIQSWRQIFVALLKLGSDADIVIRQLFNPLSLQVIHWCTMKNNRFIDVTLDIVIEGMVQSEDPRRRDFSSVCLEEYFQWCNKHHNEAQMSKVVKYLTSLSQHAAPQYRQGSVLGFNSIYRTYREHDQLCDRYTLQLIHAYITSLSLSSEFEETSLLVRSTKRAIQHLERIVKKKGDQLNVEIRNRKKPADLSSATLRALVDWLTLKSADCWHCCRRECFRLITEFSPFLRGIADVENYFTTLQNESKNLIHVAEKAVESVDNFTGFDHFLNALEKCSDFYAFLKQTGYPAELLLQNKQSRFLKALRKFLLHDLDGFKNSSEAPTDQCTQVLEIIVNISQLDNLLTADLEAKVIESSAVIWKLQSQNLFREHRQLVDTWKKYWSHCKDYEEVVNEFAPCLKKVFSVEFSADLSVSSLKWLSYVAHRGFLHSIFSTGDLLRIFGEIWIVVEDLVFQKKEGKILEERQLSNRERTVVQFLFEMAVGLRVKEDEIVERVFDPTQVKRAKTKISKGEIYQNLFLSSLPLCGRILEFRELMNKHSLENVGKLIQRLLVSVKNNHRLRKECGEIIVKKSLEIWKQLALNCTFPVIAGLISGMAALSMDICKDSRELCDWWCGPNMMKNPNLTLKDKSDFIHFLGLFTESKNEVLVQEVLSAVSQMLMDNLTTELSWNVEKNYIVKILQALLNVFEKIPRNLEIVRIIVLLVFQASLISDSVSNTCSVLAKKRLLKIVPSALDYSHQLSVLSTIYELVMGDNVMYRRTMAVSKYCLLPLLPVVTERAAKMFYLEHVNDLAERGRIEPKNIPEACMKITAINLIEILCLRKWNVGRFFCSPELNAKYTERLGFPAEAKSTKFCARELIKACTNFTLPSTVADEKLRKFILEANQSAFNVIQAGVRELDTPLNYAVNLVVKFSSRNRRHWENVVDCSTEYTFPVVLERNKTEAETAESEPVTVAVAKSNARATRKFALMTSSLAMEATAYDFTASVTMDNSKYYQKILGENGDEETTSTSYEAIATVNAPKFEQEWSEVNQHPCMLAFVESLKNFDAKKARPGNENILKEVLEEMHKLFLSNPEVHKNIKIFLVGAILNCKSIFKPVGNAAGSTILKLITEGVFDLELNYFVKDALIMLLEWKDEFLPEASQVLQLLKFYLPKVYNSREDVLRQHLSLLEVIMKEWVSDSDIIPRESLAEIFLTDMKTALRISKHILLAEKLPFSIKRDPEGIDLRKFFSIASKTFSGTSKVEYSLAGEVVGLVFKTLEDKGEQEEVEGAGKYFCAHIFDKIKGRPQIFFAVLKSIQLHYSRIVRQYRGVVLESLRDRNVGLDALRMVPTILKSEMRIDEADGSAGNFEELYTELYGRGLFKRPCRTSEELEAAVDIIEGFVGLVTDESKARTLISWAQNAESSSDPKLKARYASAVSKLYFSFREGKEVADLSKVVHQLFISLYDDENEEVGKIVTDFWEQDLKSRVNTPILFLELMEMLATDKNSLHITIDLVIKRCSLSPDYPKAMFDSLGDCVFQPYNLDTSWRMRNASFQPLYAESLSSMENFDRLPRTLQSTLMSQRQTTGKLGMNLLKATLERRQFTPTAPGQYHSPSSLVSSQSSGNTFNSQAFFGGFNAEQNLSPESEGASPLEQLRRRFYARPSGESYYSGRQATRTEVALQRQLEVVRSKRSGVKLLRAYRIGELPDVVMKHADFLKMISAMTKIDQELGRAFLVQVVTSMLSEEIRRDEVSKLQRHATKIFNEILKTHGASLSPQFAAAIVEIVLTNHGSIHIHPHLVSVVCRNFELQKLGILQFEEMLEGDRILEGKDSKRRKMNTSEETPEADVLLRLAELYKDIEDFDSIPNLFEIASEKSRESKEIYQRGCQALRLEGKQQYDEALNVYSNLCEEERARQDDVDERRLQLWEAAIQKCLTHLSKWETLFEFCEGHGANLGSEDPFSNMEYLDLMLPFQLAAATQILVRDQSEADEEPPIVGKVHAFVEALRGAENVWEVLQSETMDIPVMSAVFEHELGVTSTFLDRSLSASLDKFRNFRKLSKMNKEKELLKLQRGSVLSDYLNWYRNRSYQDLEDATSQLLSKWKHVGRPKTASLMNTDILVAERDHYMTKVGLYVDDSMLDAKDQMLMELRQINYLQYLWLAELSILDRNSGIALNSFKRARSVGTELDPNLRLEWQKLFSFYLVQFTEGQDWEKFWGSAWKSRGKLDDADKASTAEAKCLLLKALLIKTEGRHLEDETKVRQALQITSSADLMSHVLQLVTEMAQFSTREVIESTNKRSGIHMQVYHLLKSVLGRDVPSKSSVENENLNKLMITSLLRAMEGDEQEAMYMFPTIFETLEQYPTLIPELHEHVAVVPAWMFLPWLDQIVVNHLHNPVLKDILGLIIDRLLAAYPQAFQLQYVDLMKRKKLPQMYLTFAEALHAVTVPWIFFRKYVQHRRTVADMILSLDEFQRKADEVRGNSSIFGGLFQAYLSKIIPVVQNTRRNLENLGEEDSSRATPDAEKIWEDFKTAAEKTVPKELGGDKPRKLSELSPWLAKYRSSAFETVIEVPGLYSKFEKPNLYLHPKIVSFFPTVSVLFSLSKPIRLRIMCDDGKERSYLVKRGDDLRQDKRIQQCFHVANAMFRNEPQCRERKLRLSTFAVVPLDEEFGIIEWVNETASLKELILNSRELQQKYYKLCDDWDKLIKSLYHPHKHGVALSDPYNVFAQVCSRSEAEKRFNDFQKTLPSKLLRNHLLEGCNSLEDFFVIRQNMVRSYGTMCLVHWLFGIGDRHLENSLISKTTGEFIGIDFGRAFGTPIFLQSIPELVPFRLTAQIQDLLAPYGCRGILKETMMKCLMPLKKHSNLVLSVVDVFMREPVKDWLIARQRSSSRGSDNGVINNIPDWDAIKTLKRKLSGENPVKIIVQDLQLLQHPALRQIYTTIIKDGRGPLGLVEYLEDEKYVDMLISIATDKNILSRMYSGWAPWV